MTKTCCTLVSANCILAVFVGLFTAAAHAQPVKLELSSKTMSNIDLPGSDIDHIVMKKPSMQFDLRQEQCVKACSDNKDCVAWTYVRPNTIQGPDGNCWLKNSIPAQKNSNCCVSGTIGEVNTDRPGSDYKHFDNVAGAEVTANLCQKECYKEEKCKAWTFVKPNTFQGPKGVCWLKDSVPSPVKNESCISGYFKTDIIK
ncbi:MAG: hypothetical protein D3906_11060 [Candidatus Electrothrix sp. AUS1_2]|nr:hypothetical protein [Candidatus Electrothrix sp. AUS1_2]